MLDKRVELNLELIEKFVEGKTPNISLNNSEKYTGHSLMGGLTTLLFMSRYPNSLRLN